MKNEIDNNTWQYWNVQDEEVYGFFNTDPTYIDISRRKGFKSEFYLRIQFPVNLLAEDGQMPTPAGFEFYRKFEDIFEKLLENNNVNCKKVHFAIYNGARRLLFEVNDILIFKECVSALEAKMGLFEFKLEENKPWTIYKGVLPDEYDNQQIANRNLMELLIEKGSNPEKKHFIEHAFFGKKRKLKRIESELLKMEGRTITFEKDFLEIGVDEILEEETINEMTYFCMDLAKEFNCNYDGWSTTLIK